MASFSSSRTSKELALVHVSVALAAASDGFGWRHPIVRPTTSAKPAKRIFPAATQPCAYQPLPGPSWDRGLLQRPLACPPLPRSYLPGLLKNLDHLVATKHSGGLRHPQPQDWPFGNTSRKELAFGVQPADRALSKPPHPCQEKLPGRQ